MKRIGIITLLCTLFSCAKGQVFSCNNMTTDSLNIELTATKDTARKSLNDIRFEGWKEQDWVDNKYIRTLRKYIDAYNNGEIENASLNIYQTKGKFAVYNVEPFLLGGLLISIGFLDAPETIFEAWVYSDVEKGVVTDYKVRNIKAEKMEDPFTKEEILQIIEEHPENKLW